VEQLGPNRITLTVSAKGSANGCQQDIDCDNDLLVKMVATAGFLRTLAGNPYQMNAALTTKVLLDV
jgi:hypothetical protein